jgi:hypothetical protein
MAPRSLTRRPRDSSYTEDVAKRGLDAVRERKNSTGYDRTQRDQALALVASGARYPANADTDLYSDWRGTRGFMPSSYDINYGRTDEGKYAGFKTAGDLKAATLGYAEFEREQDRAQAQALAMLADQRLGALEDEYTDRRINITDDDPAQAWMQHMPQMGKVGEIPTSTPAEMEMLSRNAEVQDRIDNSDKTAPAQHEYNAALDQWLAENSDKYLTAQEFAGEVQDTPLRDYATIAGQAYGIDPMIVRGWYDEASQIGDFREQRDLESLDNYGMPYGEYEQALTDMQQQGEQGQEQYDQQTEDAMRAQVEADTGLPADELLNGARITLPDLYEVTGSADYLNYVNDIAEAQYDPDTINEILDNVRPIDPMLYRVLFAQFNYLADTGNGG